MKDRELPEAARGGKLVVSTNPQPEVRKNAETARIGSTQTKPNIYTGWQYYSGRG